MKNRCVFLLLLFCCSVSFAQTSVLSTLEYWLNEDFDHCTVVSLGGGTSKEIELDMATAGIQFGLNFLHYRVKDNKGYYSSVITKEFLKRPNTSNVVLLEYWFNQDFAEKKQLSVSQKEWTADFETGNLPFGVHTLHFRLKTQDNAWSSVYSKQIFKNTITNSTGKTPTLTGYRYWFDEDWDNLQVDELPFPALYLDRELQIATPFEGGSHKLSIQFIDSRSNYSQILSGNFTVNLYFPVTEIVLDCVKTEMFGGEVLILSATVLPENASNPGVIWSSSHPDVAKVNSAGQVTAIDTGTTIITATTEDGGFTAICEIKVTVPVTDIALNKATTCLLVGNSEQLSAIVYPGNATNPKVIWSSSNTTIVSVDNTGFITGNHTGTAIITATTEEGGKTSVCEVIVEANAVSVECIALDGDKTMYAGETLQLFATIVPSNATNQNVLWQSSNTSVAEISTTGLVTARSAGTTTIAVTTDDGGFTATCELRVEQDNVGIGDIANAAIRLYLKGDNLFVDSPVLETVTMYSVSGILIYSNSKQAGEIMIPIRQIPNQVLIVRGGSGWVRKVMK